MVVSLILLSAVGLFKLLFFLLFVYIVIRVVSWFLLLARFSSRSTPYGKESTKDREGDITIHFSRDGKKKTDKDDGEYVDFEEIKE